MLLQNTAFPHFDGQRYVPVFFCQIGYFIDNRKENGENVKVSICFVLLFHKAFIWDFSIFVLLRTICFIEI